MADDFSPLHLPKPHLIVRWRHNRKPKLDETGWQYTQIGGLPLEIWLHVAKLGMMDVSFGLLCTCRTLYSLLFGQYRCPPKLPKRPPFLDHIEAGDREKLAVMRIYNKDVQRHFSWRRSNNFVCWCCAELVWLEIRLGTGPSTKTSVVICEECAKRYQTKRAANDAAQLGQFKLYTPRTPSYSGPANNPEPNRDLRMIAVRRNAFDRQQYCDWEFVRLPSGTWFNTKEMYGSFTSTAQDLAEAEEIV